MASLRLQSFNRELSAAVKRLKSTSTMIATTALDASGQEDTMAWFTPMLRNWIGLTYLGEYLSYGIHVFWFLLVPLILAYSAQLAIYCFFCVVNILLYIFKKKNNLQEDTSSKSWDKAKKALAYFLSSFTKLWHGCEIIGLEHIPEGPALIIFYHGPVAVDYMNLISILYRQTGRLCYSLCDQSIRRISGIKLFLDLIGCADYNKAECVELLKAGKLLGIAPGGFREVNFSDDNYTLVWGNRTGFAQVALEAKVPIIPMFTQNIREAFRTFGNTRLSRWVYECTRWLNLPLYGGFPVKLRTYIGEPIPYDPDITAKELTEKEIINVNKCYNYRETSMTYSDCFASVLEEWIFLKHLLYAVIGVLVLTLIILAFFIIPLSNMFFVYLSALFILIYQKTHKLNGAYSSNKWDGARLILLTLWDGFARFWHGYELYGTENLPDGPGVLIFYHGAIPIDHAYFLARFFLQKQKCFYTVADDFVFKCPGVKTLTAVMCLLPKKKEPCLNALKNGHLVGISPGGTREALFSDESYKLLWHKRKGFAEVALDAKVPIIPMYTQNIREAYRVFGTTALARWLYERCRLPVLPPYGGFPVKFRTYIGEPIPYDPNITAEELAQKAKTALQSLIQKHQQIPGSICNALMERLHKEKKK